MSLPPRLVGLLVVCGAALAFGLSFLALRDRGAPKLDCPKEQVHLDEQGVARCGPGQPLTAAQGRTVGQKANLNEVSAEELAQLPGIGETLAQAIVKRRGELGKFQTFREVDEVPGVGPAKLEALKQMVEIR